MMNRMFRSKSIIYWYRLSLLCLFLPFSPASASDEDWQQIAKNDEHNIVVYYRMHSTGNPEFRATTQMNSTLSGFVALFRDVEAMPKWVSRTVKAEVLSWESETSLPAAATA